MDILDFPAITICNVNKHKRTEFTLWDLAVMGPHLEMTDENVTLLHPELYPQDWYNDTFSGTDWDAVRANHTGESWSTERM